MTRGGFIAGLLATALCVAGAAVSAPWAARTFGRPDSVASDSAHKRTCVDADGKRFEWNYPNPPFGTLGCSE